MSTNEILDELTSLDLVERLAVIETALHGIRTELERGRRRAVDVEPGEKLAAAAALLLPEYEHDHDLTAFTSLDGEPVHAQE